MLRLGLPERSERHQGDRDRHLGVGQTTDDSELMLCLLYALAVSHNSSSSLRDEAAANYNAWFQSGPFSCGQASANAFGHAYSIAAMMEAAARLNRGSEANGALMRCAPIAVWMRRQPLGEIVRAAREDAELSHPSAPCKDANAALCVAMATVIRTGNAQERLAQAERFVRGGSCCPTIMAWFEESLELADVESYGHIRCRTNFGHVRHAFVLCMLLLRIGAHMTYEDAVFRVLKLGGDTDTNACICGYVMGAIHGLEKSAMVDTVQAGVPSYMYTAVLEFDCAQAHLTYPRPRRFRSSNVVPLLNLLA